VVESGLGKHRHRLKSRAEQSRAEQSRAEQSRAEQSRAESSSVIGVSMGTIQCVTRQSCSEQGSADASSVYFTEAGRGARYSTMVTLVTAEGGEKRKSRKGSFLHGILTTTRCITETEN